MPKVSVIIPAYNAEATVGTAVDSVLAQTFEDLELTVVDDGSSDRTADEVKARRDARLRCLRTQNGGVARARNRGLYETSGEWVAFLDADDVWRPRKLARQLEELSQAPGAGLCFTSAIVVDGSLRETGREPAHSQTDFTRELLLQGNVISGGGSSVLARRSLIDRVGDFTPELSQCADWDLWLRLSLITSFAVAFEELVLYRRVAGTMSGNPDLLERDTFALLDSFYRRPESHSYREIRRRAYANHWMICAGTYLHARRGIDAVRCVSHGLRCDVRTAGRPMMAPARWVRRATG